MAALPFSTFEGADFGIATKPHMQHLQRQQDWAKTGTRPFGALGHQRDTAMVAGEHLQNQAGLAPVIAVQHIRGFV
jgi:hypothetical protein